MKAEENPAAIRPNPLVKIFLVGLPLGLVILGALSFVLYFHKRDLAHAPPKPSQLSGMMRKDLNLDSFKRYASVFKDRVGPRSPDKPDNFAVAASYVDSAMGFDNMGYQTKRREISLPKGKFEAVEAELPGKQEPRRLVLVSARYDGARDEDMAALLSLAADFTGTEHRATIRFVALVGDAKDDDAAARARYERFITEGGFADVSQVPVSGILMTGDAGALEKLRELEKQITQLADGKK